MTITCPECGTVSKDVPGREVWPREAGFLEMSIPDVNGMSSVYCACSKACCAKMLRKVIAKEIEVQRTGNPSAKHKCDACGIALQKNANAGGNWIGEGTPCAPAVHAAGKDYFFCSNACMLKGLEL